MLVVFLPNWKGLEDVRTMSLKYSQPCKVPWLSLALSCLRKEIEKQDWAVPAEGVARDNNRRRKQNWRMCHIICWSLWYHWMKRVTIRLITLVAICALSWWLSAFCKAGRYSRLASVKMQVLPQAYFCLRITWLMHIYLVIYFLGTIPFTFTFSLSARCN